MVNIGDLGDDSRASDPSAPFVTYYDATTGERTELSGTSFANWRAKTANYLRDGLGVEQRARVGLWLPAHWVVPVWIAAARAVGATVVTPRPGDDQPPNLDVAVIGPDRISTPPAAADVVACSLEPLAQPFRAPLPVPLEDYFGEVRAHGDHFSDETLSAGIAPLDFGDGGLDANAMEQRTAAAAVDLGLRRGARIMITAADPSDAITSSGLLLALYDVPIVVGGSVVIVRGYDRDAVERIASQERVTDAPNL